MQSSETDRFDRLLAENAGALSRLAASFTRTASDRDDLLQEIALALWRALPQFRGDCSERTFLLRVAHNRAIDYAVRRRNRLVGSDEEIEIGDPRPSAEAGLMEHQRRERLLDAVRRLPIVYRQVVTLTLEGLDYGEIAEVLGVSVTNVGVRLTRAKQKLREMLEGHL